MREAHARKHGGRVHGEGEEAKHHAGKRARGGAVARKEGGSVIARKEGGSVIARKHGGRVAGRARGGATGSDKRPLSSAANVKHGAETHGGATGAGPANELTDH
jgi:hypothetical protein